MNASQAQPTPERDKFISGIYNYCDRWCERCTLTSRCMTFAAEQRFREGEEIDEVMNDMFWSALERNPEQEHDAEQEATHTEVGFDFADYDDDEDDDTGGLSDEADIMEEMEKKQIEKHPCFVGGRRYFDLVRTWYQSAQHLEQLSDEQYSQRANYGVPQADAAASAATVRDMFEVITFYHLSICAKLRRAVHGKSDEVVGDDYPSDSDGSAKVALIGIDRSIAAWMTLQRHLPEQEEAAIRALLLLNKLRTVSEHAFPNARLFVRPGFDDEAA